MTRPASTPPRSFQRTNAAWTDPSAGRVGAGAPPSSHSVTFRARSVEFGAVVLEVDFFEDAWRAGVRELGAGPLGALLDAAFDAAAQTVTHEPLHALSLEVRAPAPYRLRSACDRAGAGRRGPGTELAPGGSGLHRGWRDPGERPRHLRTPGV